ncbi:hypothetical protein COW36_17380 [bacterium (Candidatus Blackallbacteria) CG17_big_fil_post_rev_8_21_14_2_50_48_46]|uniref:Transglycosylase SLT domain-containing protein n=1 Tax=bacterium (Candidatus Blackallbacteria) CG17_big_fil_post_rev_8_21_14_2_50_48_46 TaxID=2014261 RepID=A0A2M7G0F0_9BACT|nr:MAG: hypothetical protein COW64_01350 [bacterium (Candidatus Blackallbacteria) CG18_big_fil_WC_8_21_14_2_50_49_26]PIW15194.1 MAG: hypothetical protein COW36_17380 [bacterium (Candidatus Blackallbacteria) CG17_big_fil_post_rev_8_21_14_2_50_48_46]PIW44781.1 MAG: hypothetical protein COW20_22715 [bacterium (Candidatus Blackallbacteria) CG13_big_fil_rev_8_21_14_2_50_49_14]
MKKVGLCALLLAALYPTPGVWAKANTAELAETHRIEAQIKAKQTSQAETALFNLLRKEEDSVLRPYWFYLLAGLRPSQDDPRNYLHNQRSLSAAYYAWRALKTPAKFCSQDWQILSRLLPTTSVKPTLTDSRQIQERLHCSAGLPESQRLNLAQWLKENRFYWLIPRLLKNPQSNEALFESAQVFIQNQDDAHAYPLLSKLLKQPAKTAQERQWHQQALVQAGLCQARMKNSKNADFWWQQLSPQDQENYPEMLWQKARVTQRQGHQASQILNQLSQNYPQHVRTPEALWILLQEALRPFQPNQIIPLARILLKYHPNADEAPAARYWLARSLETQSGPSQETQKLYQKLAQGPLNQYYTHLGQCHLNHQSCYQRAYPPLKNKPVSLDFLEANPLLKEIAEDAQHEILEVIAPFLSVAPKQEPLLKAYAYLKNKHYFRSIRTLWLVPSRDPEVLSLMYPLLYEREMQKFSQKYALPQALVAGLTWQESMYKADIRSRAGAVGLMQLMPATARETAAKAGLKGFKQTQLTQPEINIQLGSFYLREQLNRWQGDLIPTIASYNAGPGAVSRWKRSFGELEADLFIEQIPYDETRRYVKQVLTHSWVYANLYQE